MRTLQLLLLSAALSLGGCAAIDPHNILSRNVRDTNSDFQLDVLGQWGRTAAFDFVWDTINRKYVDPKFNGVDWTAAGGKYRPLAMGAKTDEEFWDLLNKMTGELRDSHTRVEPPQFVTLRRRQQSVSLGIDVDRIEGKIAIVYVTPDSDAWWAGIRPGMEVVKIDGTPAEQRYAAILEGEREQSTKHAKERRAFRTMLLGEPDTKMEFELVRHDGSKIETTLTRKVVAARPSAMVRTLPSGHVYLRFSSFSMSVRGRVLEAIRENRSAPGLIIDLRNNGGGAALLVEDIAELLLTKKTEVGQLVTRTGEPVRLFGFAVENLKRTLEGSPDAYDKPVVVLINGGSASASELLAGWFQDIGRVKVIGQRSCGCLQGYLGYASVPGGGELAYSEIGMVSMKGHRIESEGVVPDIEIPLTAEDLRMNRDRSLEAAVDVLRKEARVLTTKR